MRRALVVGIDDYVDAPLNGCVSDAQRIALCLAANGDGSPNFDVRKITSDEQEVTGARLDEELGRLFEQDAETVVFFFAGHGIINETTNSGHLVAQDGAKPNWGVSLSELINRANKAYPNIQSTVIILDSCHSGFAGEVAGLGEEQLSALGPGLTIMTACHRLGLAAEDYGGGLFTSLLVEGLSGSAADILGRISPASLYTLVDQTLGPWEQRPIYKANVQSFVSLRTIPAKVDVGLLRRFPEFFPSTSSEFALDPSFERDRSGVPEDANLPEPDEENCRVFRFLQECNRQGLIVPVDAEHMYYAAIESKSCRLTALGAHYRKLAEERRF